MKRISAIVLCLFVCVLCGCDAKKEETKEEEIRAVWLSVYDMGEFKGVSEGGFTAKAERMFRDIAERGFNHVFLQVRPCSDALYKSEIFPWSQYISGEQGLSPGYDPLKIFLNVAHSYNLKIHAWINPYRISSTSTDMKNLSSDNPAIKMYKENQGDIYFAERGIYYNPASLKVQKLILDGVRELVNNYNIDGIHIDDFFYPTTDKAIDEKEYTEYCDNSGKSTLDDWRREQVNVFVSGMYTLAKSLKKDIIVSISPSADIDADMDIHYADVKLWSRQQGFCDWIIPQVYYGFKNETMPFEETVEAWGEIVTHKNIKLIIGMSAYKCGEEDYYAGSGKNEWAKNNDILSRQLEVIRQKECDGFSLFSYNSLAVPNYVMEEEWKNFEEEMNKIISSSKEQI